MKNKIILFDLGGVLVELVGVQTMLNWLPNNVNENQLWEMWLTSSAVRKFETGKCEPNEFAENIISEMQLPVSVEEFLFHFTQWPKQLFEGSYALLSKLQSEYTLALLSNTNTLHWNKIVNEMNIASFFDHLFLSHKTGLLKPDKEVFLFSLKSLKCDPADLIFLDDNIINVTSARSIGITAYTTKGLEQAESVLENIGIL